MTLNLSAIAVRERAVTLFALLLLVAAGIYAFFMLGRAEDPNFTIKTLTVTTAWPGATAREMQDLVAEPLEKRLQELAWYDRVETTARPGYAYMTVTLKDSTPPGDVEAQFYQARKKLGDEARNLPTGVFGPFVNDEYSDVSFALYALKAKGMPMRELARQAEAIRQDLLHVPGVKKINILGERPEQIFVEFSYDRLATLGVSALDIVAALQRQNTVTPAGSVDTRGPRVFIRIDGAYDSVRAIADTPIVAAGQTLRLSDIAEVRRGYEDPPTYLIRRGGEPTIMLAAVMQEGWDGLALGRALEDRTAAIGQTLPLGMTLEKVSDQAVNIKAAVDEFMMKFAMALGALILALGLLVDDAIIAIEVMVVKMEEGMDRIKAAAYAWSHTAAPMLSGTLVTIAGFLPVGFARSTAGEYAGNIFWVVGFALIVSWIVAVVFTPYLGVRMLPAIKPVEGGHQAIYGTPNYRRLRRLITLAVRHKFVTCGIVGIAFALSVVGMGAIKQQFFPTSDRPEVLVEVRLPDGTSIETTTAAVETLEDWLDGQPEALTVTSYVGQGAPRFFFAMAPELPDPAFAKIVVLTPDAEAREALKQRLRGAVAEGLAPEAHVRVTQLVFGPYTPFPVEFRIMGPDPAQLYRISEAALDIMRGVPDVRQANRDWGNRAPVLRFVPDQDRLNLIGLSSTEVSRQLQFLLTGIAVTQVREDIRNVPIMARSAGGERLDPTRLADFSLMSRDGQPVPLDQIGRSAIHLEEPILKRRDRVPVITIRSDIDEATQPPEVSKQIMTALQPLIATFPAGYRIEMGGSIEEAAKANAALGKVFPLMIAITLIVVMAQVRSFSMLAMVLLTAPLGLVGVVPTLLAFNQPFGFNAILGLIGLAGIVMRNTLILTEQIKENRAAGLDDYRAVIEATVQRTRPVMLTALAAVLAFIPLTHSVFWGSMAYTLIGGTAVGTVLILLFLPALYAAWFRIRPVADGSR
ncbi:efflux RND transporter permease subunit (plasmid) [Tistrella bauzanensis]|uniref:efflux RND transporter permease subunit n=1 Tax=Tistrella TaxID=171436 RepID=UPI0031F6234F